jgi:hypothetical protein
MSEELKCPSCQQKDKEIASLIEELNNLSHLFDRILEMAKRNNGVVHFSNDDTVWQISTDDTDNNVGSMEEKK